MLHRLADIATKGKFPQNAERDLHRAIAHMASIGLARAPTVAHWCVWCICPQMQVRGDRTLARSGSRVCVCVCVWVRGAP